MKHCTVRKSVHVSFGSGGSHAGKGTEAVFGSQDAVGSDMYQAGE